MPRTSARSSPARRRRRAARVSAGFDIVYVYAGMGYLPYEFLLPEWNRRTDAYGGSVRNRVRIVRELLEATHEAVGGKCAVALRISLEELRARPSEAAASEAHEVVALLSGPAGPVGREARLLAHRLRARRALPPRAATRGSSTSSRSSPTVRWSASGASPRPTPW